MFLLILGGGEREREGEKKKWGVGKTWERNIRNIVGAALTRDRTCDLAMCLTGSGTHSLSVYQDNIPTN